LILIYFYRYQPPGPYDVYWRGKIEDDRKNKSKKPSQRRGDKPSIHVGGPEVKFQRRQKSNLMNQDSNKSASASGKKDNKQRKNEKRRASKEMKKDTKCDLGDGGNGKNGNKTVKESVGSKNGNGPAARSVGQIGPQGGVQLDEPMES
jgi:hypothetical protein